MPTPIGPAKAVNIIVTMQPPHATPSGPARFEPLALHPALRTLLADRVPDADAIEAFLTLNEFPLVEPGAATFVWHGAANRVELLRWIHAGVDTTAFQRLPGTALWVLRVPVEDGGRFEYKFNVMQGGRGNWVLDPLNPARAGDPFGENSVCRTWGYARPDWSEPNGAPAGRVEAFRVESEVFGHDRDEQVYLPAGYSPDKIYPLVIIHDGQEFITYGDLSVSLDNLIAAGDVPPLIAVLVQTRDRMREYPKGRRHARYLVQEVLPAVTAAYAISADPQDRVLLGASLGAVASLSTAFRFPGEFGGLVLKSGAFILDKSKLEQRHNPVFHRIARLVQVFQRAPSLPDTRAFVSTGELEGLADENRALASFLQDHGVDVLFKSAWDGHHWHNWRDQLRDGLMWVLRRDTD